jgi:hypothetical protein
MKKIKNQIRQGDVLIQPIGELPPGVAEMPHNGKIVLAEGEATGHEHAVRAKPEKIRQFTKDSELYLVVNEPVELTHQEHGPASLEPGTYQVRRQVEQWMDEVRRVAD